MEFNVIVEDVNKKCFKYYNVLPLLVKEVKEKHTKYHIKNTYESIKDSILKISLYYFWSKCEYESVLVGWPNDKTQMKWDVHYQIKMNIEVITQIVYNEISKKSYENYI